MCAHDIKKNELKPWLQKQWVIPPQANADFVCAMEDVLEVYIRPYDPARPVVCLDELNKQLVAEIRTPLPVEPGQPARFDYQYERRGTGNVFMINEPLIGQRSVTVTEQRTAVDFARVVRDLLEVRYPHAEKVVLVMDNLNTHKPAALYSLPNYNLYNPINSFLVWLSNMLRNSIESQPGLAVGVFS